MFPEWFKSRVETMGEVADMLARSRPRFRYPYEYESEDHKVFAEKIRPAMEELFQNCKVLIEELFR
jgi:predicted transcriptional regulator